jgi:hypothetical protein
LPPYGRRSVRGSAGLRVDIVVHYYVDLQR